MKKNGFSLIELLVTIAILVLITGGAIAAFSNFNDRRVTEQAARDLRQMFISAQQKAAVKQTPQSCIDADLPLRGYRVIISGTPKTISLRAICLDNSVAAPFDASLPAANLVPVESKTLPSTVNISPTTSVDFYTLQAGISATPTYTITGSSATYQFAISTGGTIGNVEQP